MVSAAKKIIKGKEYLYAEHSFRLPDGKIIKSMKRIAHQKDAHSEEMKKYFMKKELEENERYAIKIYSADAVLPNDKIMKAETMKVEYKYLLRKLTKKQLNDILDRFTVNFTYESNAIEGNSLTLKDVTMILRENIVPKGKDLREVYETRNTRIVNELLFKNKIKITRKDIIKIHSILIKDTGVQPGFKKFPNFLLMRNVKTTAPEDVESEMAALINWYLAVKDNIHPINIATEFHGRFEKIHPFEDRNGRVGRILINAILLEQGYPPIIIRKTTRQAYFSALESFDNGFKPKFERFLLEKFEDTFEKFFKIYIKYL